MLDANVPLFAVSTLEDQLDASFAQTRQAGRLSGVFGILALTLSGIGVYGVTAFAISRRTRELGVRIALGARRGHILTLIVRRGLVLTIAGLILGLLGAAGFAQLAEALLFGVTAATSRTTYVVTALVAFVSLVGCCIPLRAATKLDVAEAIRHD